MHNHQQADPAHGRVDVTPLLADVGELLVALVAERRAEQRWRTIKRLAFSAIFLGSLIGYFLVYGGLWGLHLSPRERSVVVIPIEGAIAQGATASADRVVPLIERACADGNVAGLVLHITSPGGAPSEAERMAAALSACRSGQGKPVYAHIDGTGASAAYLLAVHADAIAANEYAMVGSIGAVMSGFDLTEGLARLGVRERTYASGELKTMNSPFRVATRPEQLAAQQLVDQVAAQFADTVRARRGAALKPDGEFTSGRLWLAPRALEMGLIDEIAVYDGFVRRRFGDLPVVVYHPQRTFQELTRLESLARLVAQESVTQFTLSSWN